MKIYQSWSCTPVVPWYRCKQAAAGLSLTSSRSSGKARCGLARPTRRISRVFRLNGVQRSVGWKVTSDDAEGTQGQNQPPGKLSFRSRGDDVAVVVEAVPCTRKRVLRFFCSVNEACSRNRADKGNTGVSDSLIHAPSGQRPSRSDRTQQPSSRG